MNLEFILIYLYKFIHKIQEQHYSFLEKANSIPIDIMPGCVR